MNSNTFYKILQTETGLFSTGGHHPKWSKAGKAWSDFGHLKRHLHDARYAPGTAEVVECVTQVISNRPLEDVRTEVMTAYRTRRDAEKKRSMDRYEKRMRDLGLLK